MRSISKKSWQVFSGALATALFFGPVQAADAPAAAAADDELAEVVVTGTAIRGVAPVGTNLITIGRAAIEESGGQTMQQILSSVPAITGFGNAAQGGFQSFDGAGTFAPTIHGLGASASNGTLVLVDGHRLPLSGINHTLADPNVIAPLAIERVEVLPEGASSTYGSDAVAGVLNFITRRNYSGFEANAQGSKAGSYNSYSAGFLWGETWDRGSALFTYNLSKQSNLLRADRKFTDPDHRAVSGGNFLDGNCGPASVQSGANVYLYPYTTIASPNPTSANNGACSYVNQSDLLPENERHNVLAKLTRQINDSLEFSADIVYSQQRTVSAVNRGTITATVFGPGNAATTQINPYYTQPTGAAATTQTVRWAADDLFGPGAKSIASAQTFFVTSGLTYKFARDWQAAFGLTAGVDDSSGKTVGALCSSCALLALNGTARTDGNATLAPVPNSPVVLNSSLTTAGGIALDVWSPAASNRTNAATRAYLLDSTTLQSAHQSLHNYTLKLDGPVATLPGGELRLAAGAAYASYIMNEELQAARGTGPVSLNSRAMSLRLGRDVTSFFGEVLVPIVGNDNAMPFIRKLELDLSARSDRYSDFGNTSNPKVAFTWGVTDSFSVRGNVGKSFTAPALTSRGDDRGITAESGFSGAGAGGGAGIPGNFQIPITFPGAANLPAGACNVTTGLCTIATAAVTGLVITGGNKDLKPETGKSFSLGFDYASKAIEGLRFSATYWSAKYEDAITAPQAAFAIAAPGLNSILHIYGPTGATQAEIDALTSGLPQTGALQGPVYWSYSFQQRNAFSLDATGIDLDLGYAFNTGAGAFDTSLSISRKLKMDQRFGSDGGSFSVLNSVGVNTTFPSVKMTGRASFGWKRNNWNAKLFANYVGSYLNWSGTANQGNAAWTITRAVSATGAALWPTGGGQPIGASTTFDLHAGYDFKGDGATKGVSVSFDGNNIFDREPNFFNTSTGYDNFNANPIGRLLTLGVSKKW